MTDIKEPQIVELAPHEWKSEREKPREPLFGPGLPFFVAFIVGLAIVSVAHQYGPLAQFTGGLIGASLTGLVMAIYR
jgi:hypothetical protein